MPTDRNILNSGDKLVDLLNSGDRLGKLIDWWVQIDGNGQIGSDTVFANIRTHCVSASKHARPLMFCWSIVKG